MCIFLVLSNSVMAQWNFNPGPTTGDIETDAGLGNDTVKVLNGTDGGFVVRQGFVIYDQNGAPVGSPLMPAGSWWVWLPTESAMRMGTITSTTPWNPATNVGFNSFAAGNNCVARGDNAMAIGDNAQARAINAAAFGLSTRADGDHSLSAGELTSATATNSMAIGNTTTANGTASLVSGTSNITNGNNSFASGLQNDAGGVNSFVTGRANVADGTNSVALGQGTSTSGGTNAAIATGFSTQANADHSFAMGDLTQANGAQSVAMGHNTVANGIRSVTMGTATQTAITAPNALAIGDNTTCVGAHSFSSGTSTTANGDNSVTFGDNTQANNTNAIAMGQTSIASGHNSFAGGNQCQAQGDNSVAFGDQAVAQNYASMAIGVQTLSTATRSFAGGLFSQASGSNSFAFGFQALTQGPNSMSIGDRTDASGDNSFAHGMMTVASGDNALASGTSNVSAGNNSVALGRSVEALADNSTGIGEEIEILPVAQQAIVLGAGVIGNRLRSNRPASLISAFNTDHPTLFIASGSGPGTLGRIAIGGKGYFGMTNFNPLEMMEVWSGNLLQTNLDAVTTDQPSSQVGQNHIGLIAPGTCDFFGYTTDNTQATPVPNIANSFVRIGLNDGATANTGPEIMWDSNSILEFKIDASTTSCSPTNVVLFNDLSGPYNVSIPGDLFVGGTIFNPSDLKYKENILPINNADSLIRMINGYRYTYLNEEVNGIQFDGRKSIGFIADELVKIVPESVRKDKNGYYAVAYDLIIPILVEAFKNQQKDIDSLLGHFNNSGIYDLTRVAEHDSLINVIKDQSQKIDYQSIVISNLDDRVKLLERNVENMLECLNKVINCTTSQQNEVGELNNFDVFLQPPYLGQNEPNPFSTKTRIPYYLPESVKDAFIVVFGTLGVQLDKIEIKGRRHGYIDYSVNNQSNGTYFYQMIVDGNIISTKKMILSVTH